MPINKALELGEMVRRHRADAGLTQEQLAERAGLSARALSDLERGLHRTPHQDTLQRLAQALNLEAGQRDELSTAARRGEPTRMRTGSSAPLSVLPLALTSFVGRERQVAEVRQRLATTRLLTLTGAGGMGKTRLAIEVARALSEHYADGICCVELAPLLDGMLVPQALASALSVPEQPGRLVQDVLADALAMRRLLVVLDNCEHLVEACAELADALLRSCPDIRILATSRQPLGVAGEATWRVPALTENESTRLFVERAQAVEPGWVLTDRNAPAVAQLSRRLDGIPLAIELAAARVAVLTPEQIATRLADRLRLLTGGNRTSSPRHQTLRATVDWSYSLLAEDEQFVFNRLSVFAGGWTLEAAEIVSAGGGIEPGDVLDVLARLVNQSLVLAEHVDDSNVRYRLLETLREYGAEKLAQSGATEAVREQHAAFFLTVAEGNEPQLFGHGGMAAQAMFELEHDNLRAALRWLVEHGDTERAQRLAGSVARFWFFRGYLGEGSAALAQVLALAPNGLAGRAKSLYGAGTIDMARGEYATAETALREALRLWRDLGNADEEGFVLFVLGMVARQRGAYAAAGALFEEGVAVSRAAGCLPAEANNLAGLADVLRELGRFREARARGEDALACASTAGWTRGVVHALRVLGDVQYQLGDFTAATELLEASLARSRELGAQWLVAWTLARLGLLAIERRDLSVADEVLAESLSLSSDIGDRQGIARGLEGLAHLAAVHEEGETALRLVGAAAGVRESIGAPVPHAEQTRLEHRLGPVREAMGDAASAAAEALGRALSLQQALVLAAAMRVR